MNLELRSRLLKEINEAEDQERSRKRAKLATEKGAAAITDHFKADTSKETAADLAILEFLVANGISPHVVDHYTFKAMIQQVSKAGPAYKIPTRRDVGVSANRSVSSGERQFGRVLKTGLDLATTAEKAFLESIADIGGSLCIDGAKNFKRSALNAILLTGKGSFFAQSTNATGRYKNAEMQVEDAKSALESIGEKYVFIFVMDGACRKVLRILSGIFKKIFSQRCSTHGADLLICDVLRLFPTVIEWSVRLIKFIANHDGIYKILEEMPGSKKMFSPADTRMAGVSNLCDRSHHPR